MVRRESFPFFPRGWKLLGRDVNASGKNQQNRQENIPGRGRMPTEHAGQPASQDPKVRGEGQRMT